MDRQINIFILNEDPGQAARDLCDKHCVKMILESTQLLCAVAHKRGFEVVYKPTHKNHPATIWLGKSSANWNWLCIHGFALSKEYTLRYKKIHKCQAIIQNMFDRTKEIWGEKKLYTEHTPFMQCMPDEYKRESAVEAYRAYYRGAKADIAKWAHSEKPEWF